MSASWLLLKGTFNALGSPLARACIVTVTQESSQCHQVPATDPTTRHGTEKVLSLGHEAVVPLPTNKVCVQVDTPSPWPPRSLRSPAAVTRS